MDFSSKLYLNGDGTQVTSNNSRSIWSPECLASKADKVSIDEIRPTFCDTLSEEVLGEMVQLVEDTTKHNFMSALLVIGGTIMSCHYRQIIDTFGGFPIVIACGPTETGKIDFPSGLACH